MAAWVPLSEAINPLTAVRRTTAQVLQDANHVLLNNNEVESLAEFWATTAGSGGDIAVPRWTDAEWHYSEDAASGGPLTCQYVFVLDCLNFCFWPIPELGYKHLAFGLKVALQRDPFALSAYRLSAATEDMVRSWFLGFEVPQIAERTLKLRELGSVLQTHFGGQAAQLVGRASCSAARLVRLLTCLLPGFRDEALHKGHQCFYYTLAQILVADLWTAYGRPRPGSHSPYAFEDIKDLTMFADYRVPQILASLGILVYSDTLKAKIERNEQIQAGSEEEVEIRASSIQAVERLRVGLERRGVYLLTLDIDRLLWHESHRITQHIPPHHRTLTCFY